MSTSNNTDNCSQSQQTVEVFASLFKGRTDAWGSVDGRCNKGSVTLEHYRKHLKGEVSLGVYPLQNDGSCHFFAIDLDRKDFNLVKAIRQELLSNGIPAYIAASKSKGFHIYGFALEKFFTKDIRRILRHILKKLNIKAEVFPKQDLLSKNMSVGSYINLPCFGYTRLFLTGDLKEIPLKVAIEKIKYVPQESIDRLLRTLPEEQTNEKLGHTPREVVNMLSQPLAVGQRRDTLVKLAGYLRYRGITEDVAVALLLTWAEKCFTEELPPEEIERHIRGVYRRYGVTERKVAKSDKSWHAEVPL